MKVLFITNIPSPYRVAFFKELGKHVELTVLYEKATADDRDDQWITDEASGKNGYTAVLLPSVFSLADKAFCPAVTKYLTGDYDQIIVGGYSTPTGIWAVRYLKRHHIPYYLNCDGGFKPSSENKLKRKLKTSLISGAKGYLASGRFCDDYLTYYGADPNCIFHYPFSSVREADVDTESLSAEAKRTLRGESADGESRQILYVGQMIYRKGIDVLLKAIKDLPKEWRFVFVGGEPSSEYTEYVQRNNLTNVLFVPFMQPAKLREEYRKADLFVLPTREDIWGLVINEALAAGLPIVSTTNCGAAIELVDEGNGRLTNPDDSEALAKAIRECLADESVRSQMGQISLERARHATVEAMVAAHVEALK